MAAVMGSEKKMGSTRSTMSPDTSRKFRLFSKGTRARLAAAHRNLKDGVLGTIPEMLACAEPSLHLGVTQVRVALNEGPGHVEKRDISSFVILGLCFPWHYFSQGTSYPAINL